MERKAYPSDVSDDAWAFVAPYLTLILGDAPQRNHPLCEIFNGLRWIARAGVPWRMMPNDLPPWEAVNQPTWHWLHANVFEAMVHDRRVVLRLAEGRPAQPSTAIVDSRTLQSTPELVPGRTMTGQTETGESGTDVRRHPGQSAGLACHRRP